MTSCFGQFSKFAGRSSFSIFVEIHPYLFTAIFVRGSQKQVFNCSTVKAFLMTKCVKTMFYDDVDRAYTINIFYSENSCLSNVETSKFKMNESQVLPKTEPLQLILR